MNVQHKCDFFRARTHAHTHTPQLIQLLQRTASFPATFFFLVLQPFADSRFQWAKIGFIWAE